MAAPLFADLPTETKSYIDATSWNAIRLGTPVPLYSSLPTVDKHFIDEASWNALVAGGLSTLSGSQSLSFPEIKSGEQEEMDFTLTGATVGMACSPIWPVTLETELMGMMFVSASNTITVRILNNNRDGTAVTPAVQTFGAKVF